jgi:DNA-binding beta-propeller fold protein YncE
MLPRAPRLFAVFAFVALATGARCGGAGARGSRAVREPQVNPIAPSGSGSRFYVANTTSHSVSVISTLSHRVVEEIPDDSPQSPGAPHAI